MKSVQTKARTTSISSSKVSRRLTALHSLLVLSLPLASAFSVVPSGHFTTSSRLASTRPSTPLSTPSTTSEQVDDYLEFLNRRYQRLHQDENRNSHTDASTVSSKFVSNLAEQAQSSDNALNVLGLAGLASKRLLIKYHMVELPPPRQTPLPPVIKPIAEQRRKFLALQSSKMKALLRIIYRSILSTPRALRRLLAMSGGEKTMAATLTVASALLFHVVRPAVQAIVSEGAQQV